MFVDFYDDIKLDSADGIIMPSGIFEEIKKYRNFPGSPNVYVNVEQDLLIQREKELDNLINNGNWVCFIIDEIVDNYKGESFRDTDLCKNILNKLRVNRNSIHYVTELETRTNEFIEYTKKYGISKVSFNLYPFQEYKILISYKNMQIGFEIDNQYFFLPFHTVNKDASVLEDIIKTLVNSIINYRQKNLIRMPLWLDDIQFEKEALINEEINELENKKEDLNKEVNNMSKYKSILTTSGENLKNIIVKILREYFYLEIEDIDQYKEDAKIIYNNEVICFVEVKGTNKGIKREHINQVDSHRERSELTYQVPGILIINNQMNVEGIEQRKNTEVSSEQIVHAYNNNVLIIRTIDLLMLMLLLEKEEEERDKILIDIITAGGGWLKVDEEEYEIINNQ